jgi:hypothetical protein
MNIFLIYVIISIIIIFGLVIFISLWISLKKSFNQKKVQGKTIWLLCLTGWDKASYISKQTKDSWKKHNYSWNIELLSEENISNYIKLPNFIIAQRALNKINDQKMSEIIKLAILNDHGGVWADSNTLCMRPLDDWIFDCISIGFWMSNDPIYSGLIASLKNNYIIQTWYQKILQHWNAPQKMDALFLELLDQNERFSTIWKFVPILNNHDTRIIVNNGSSEDVSENVKNILNSQCPYFLELNNEEVKASSNADYAIQFSLQLDDFHGYIPIPHISTIPHDLLSMFVSNTIVKPPSDTLIVLSDCDDQNGVKRIINLLKEKKVQSNVMCFDKCNFGKNIPKEWIAKTFKNVGREQHTWLYFILLQYDSLPNNLIFMSTSVHKWDRFNHLKKMLENQSPTCADIPEKNGDFQLNAYDGVPIPRASLRPFSKWYSSNVKPWTGDGSKACYNGWARVSKEQILKRPKDYYKKLMVQLEKTNTNEEVHFMERSMGDVFNL